ncbi:MAG: class I SAM-dependent methyltransferase [Candidatus Kapaibacterium sp.]
MPISANKEMSGHDAATQERLAREAEFHDHSFSTNLRESEVGKFYSVARRSYECYRNLVFRNVAGKDVLEYGCGINSDGLALAKEGAKITGIDISPVAIEESNTLAEEAGLTDQVSYHVMNAEELTFADNSFDLVCGIGILHHLDLEKGYSEVARVLRPGGVAVFHEPLGHNPLINRFRNQTPHLRTPDEHPLLRADLRQAEEYFSELHLHFFHLTSLGIVPLRNSPLFKPLYGVTEGIDRLLMTILPPLRGWAWYCVMEMRK